jgi:hypothetical protein
MTIASGIETIVSYKKETPPGTIATGGAGGTAFRRTSLELNIEKETYQSSEKASHGQIQDFRHGVRRAPGTLSGDLSPLTYAPFMAAVLGKDFATGATTGALTNVTAAATAPGTFTRAAGSFLTDGFKIGDVVRWTGWTTTATGNNSRNYRITNLTATVMTVGTAATGAVGMPEAVLAKAAGDSVTCTVVGKKSWIPTTGRTFDAYTFEKWFPDIAQSERYYGVRLSGMRIQLPASGNATVQFTLIGKDVATGASQYFTSPTAETTTGINASIDGYLRAAGGDIALATGMDLTIDLGITGDPVVGSNTIPAFFKGRANVTGTMTAYFEDATLRDAFFNETEVSLYVMLRTGSGIAADFLNLALGRVKLSGSSKTDPDGGIIQTIPFQALLNTAGGTGIAHELTTISIQDSAA